MSIGGVSVGRWRRSAVSVGGISQWCQSCGVMIMKSLAAPGMDLDTGWLHITV